MSLTSESFRGKAQNDLITEGLAPWQVVVVFLEFGCPDRSTDSLAEWSKALAPGASPKGRGFEPHSCHFQIPTCVRMKRKVTRECGHKVKNSVACETCFSIVAPLGLMSKASDF